MADRVAEGKRRIADRSNSVEKGGGGGDNGSMDARVAVLEQIAKDTQGVLKEIKADLRAMRTSQAPDFRLLFGAIITVALGLAALMAHGFKWIG